MPVLVIFSDNYADEFDLEGFKIFSSKEDWEEYLSFAEKYFEKRVNKQKEDWIKKHGEPKYSWQPIIEGIDFGFGTNEALNYTSFNEFKNCFTVKEISMEEGQTIIKTIGSYFGECCVFYLEDYDE